MFTVKWCTTLRDVERERVFQTDIFEYAAPTSQPPTGGKPTAPRARPKLGIYDVADCGLVVIGNPCEGAESMAFAHGVVYVMNEQGRTVAKYTLARCDEDDIQSLATPTAKAA